MWHMAAVLVLRDSQTFLILVLNLDRPAEPGVVLDMAFTSAQVTEQDKSNGDFTTLQSSNSMPLGNNKSQPGLPPASSSPANTAPASLSVALTQSMNDLHSSESELDLGFSAGAGIICVASTCGAKVYIQLQDRAQLRHWRQIIEVASGSTQSESSNNATRKRAESQSSACNRRHADSSGTTTVSPAVVINAPTAKGTAVINVVKIASAGLERGPSNSGEEGDNLEG